MILVQRKKTDINVSTNVNDYIIVDSELGNDDTAEINSSNSCRTLEKAIELADTYNKDIKIRIVKDYNSDHNIVITNRINTNKIIITCENDSIISNLISAVGNQGNTSYVPYFIYNDGLFIENAASCDEYDAINYIEGNIISIVTPPEQSGGMYINTIELPRPDLNFTLNSKIHLFSLWHNTICDIIEIRESSIVVKTSSVNYNYQVNQYCKYRVINYQGLKEGFLYTKSDNTYTIEYNSVFKYMPKIISLTVSNSVNIEFYNCTIIGLNISINNSYAVTFNSCKFQYCDSIYINQSIVNFKNNYFFKIQRHLYNSRKSSVIISNNIFKGCSYILIQGAGLVQYNEFCYGKSAIYYNNVSRRTIQFNTEKCVIRNNYIHHMGQFLYGDFAAIYGGGNANCDIYYNVIKDCIGRPNDYYHGVYMDEGANNVSIKYNLVINCNCNFKTHFGYGNIVYNNLSAYPVKDHIAYDLNGTLQSATSFIANIFYEGTVNYYNVLTDNALFQYNLFDKSVTTSPPVLNYKTTIPFTDPKNCDFSLSVNPFTYDIISIGSTNIRNKDQSFIDTSFFDRKIKYGITETHPYRDLVKFDLQLQYQGILYKYDKWFKLAEKYFYNIENEYLNNI